MPRKRVQKVLTCRFPFPPQEPPIVMPESCSEKCPNYDADILGKHAEIRPDDRQLLAAIRSFAEWFYEPGQDIEPQIRYAANLYTRSNHAGTCIPKTILFAHYKILQLSSYGGAPRVRKEAVRALAGEEVASWPEGEIASGSSWNALFGLYSAGYDEPSM
jgi:hypothetical protein